MKIELAVLGMVRYSTKAEEVYVLTACVVANAGWRFTDWGLEEYDSPLAVACAKRGSDDVFAPVGEQITKIFHSGRIAIPCLVAYHCDDDEVVVEAIYSLTDREIKDAVRSLHEKVMTGGVS